MARINEVKKLQKIAGIIKENVNGAPMNIPGEISSLEAEGQFPKMRMIGKAIDQILDGSGIENLGYLKGLIRTFAMAHKM